MLGFENISVRFFVWEYPEDAPITDEDFDNGGGLLECDEERFISRLGHGKLSYKKHTVFDNGVRQICLTIM